MTDLVNDLNENIMIEKGREKREQAIRQALANQREADVPAFKALMSVALTQTFAEIDERLSTKAGRGKPNQALVALKETGLSGKTLGAITLQSLIAGSSEPKSALSSLQNIGKHVEDEVRFTWFAKQAPKLYKYIEKEMQKKGTTDHNHKRRVIIGAIERYDEEEVWQRWDLRTKELVGIYLADFYFQQGIIEKVDEGTSTNSSLLLRLTPGAVAAVAALGDRFGQFVRPELRPITIPPVPWVSPTEGGYHRIESPLMKWQNASDTRRLVAADMPKVYQALNAIQATSWAVNSDVLVVAEELRDNNVEVEGLPVTIIPPMPLRPVDVPVDLRKADMTEAQLAKLVGFKADTRAWHDAEGRRRSQAIQAIQTMTVARDHDGEEAIYFPHNLDFRGRIYPLPTALQPQGADLAKGLLTFGTAKPLGVWGSYWLAIHGANTWGIKGTLNERVDWVVENTEMICAISEDPLSDLRWIHSDGGSTPFQFLAFCFEWAGYIESGESPEYECALPVAVDGTCNGLQHYSGMLRDQSGAKATNLTVSTKQSDIYTEVAEAVVEIVKGQLDESAEIRELAGMWLAYGITRSTVKRAVMTTPYGVTGRGTSNMVFTDGIHGKGADRSFEWNGKENKAAMFLGKCIQQAIGEKVSSAKEAMDFIKEMVKVSNAANNGLGWTTPAGLPVLQRKMTKEGKIVRTRALGRIELTSTVDTDKMDSRAQRSGAAPNFVHSMDAAHLMLTVCQAEDERGPLSWGMVHDSYASHAGEMNELGFVIRESFVSMYEDHDVLTELKASVQQMHPETTIEAERPQMGTFDLEEVLEADFFFA